MLIARVLVRFMIKLSEVLERDVADSCGLNTESHRNVSMVTRRNRLH
jgi:hypothetical protein